ncbi:MAG: tetratricopeptide repeat protein [Pirellulales bacterium]
MRRLNVKLALWLVGITVFSVVGVHFLHGYQVDRNAEFLKVQAEQARTEGDIKEAIKQYNQYLRHRDDREGYKALAELVVEVAKEAEATRADKFRAYNILEEAIRRHPDLDDVRASLIDYTMMMRRFDVAQEHIENLRGNGSKDPELDYKLALCHFFNGEEEEARKNLTGMLGFDEDTGQFVAEPPATAKEIRAFGLLAQILKGKSGGDVQADAVMQQLVTWNPDSADAHLMRGRYLIGKWETAPSEPAESKQLKDQLFAQGKAEFDRAFQLAPDNADCLLSVATTAMVERDFAKARQHLEHARKEHPDRQDVYVRLAELEMAEGNTEQANQQLQLGLKEAKDTRRILEQLIEVQFQSIKSNDLSAVRSTIDRMSKLESIPPELVRYQDARLLLVEGKIVEATKEFEQVLPAMERLGAEQSQRVNTFLARCYEMLGLPDRQLEVNRRLLGLYPNLFIARLGEASALQSLGRHEEAAMSVALLVSGARVIPSVRGAILQLVVNQELSKPEADRNWETAEEIASMIYQDDKRSPVQNQLLKTDLLMTQGRNEEALKILTALRKESPKEAGVWLALCKLMESDAKTRDRVPQLLTLAEKELGPLMPLVAERIRTISVAGGENATRELKQQEAGLDKFNENERQALINQLGSAYLRVGNYEDAKRCWRSVLAASPTNARIRQLLFELAVDRNDEAGIQETLKELRDSRNFGPESPLYKYCAAANSLEKFGARPRNLAEPLSEEDRKLLADVRKQIDEAIAVRGEWAPLWRLRAEVDRFERNYKGAITNYQKSLNYGRANQATTARRLVTLLYAARRYSEANEALKYLSAGQIPDEMRQMVGDTKLKSGDAMAALEMAKKDVEEHPENPSNHIWYGQLLDSIGKTDEAEQAYRKATQAGPKLPIAWEFLVRRLVSAKKKNEAAAAVREASATLSEDLLAMAALYQVIDDPQQADQFYQKALAQKPDDLMVLRRVVEFSFAVNESAKAMGYLDRMIEKGARSAEKGALEQVHWARRRKAQSLAQTAGYSNTMAAVKLIEQNAVDGKMAREDILSIVGLLAQRAEHTSRAKAAELLEKLRQTSGLGTQEMSVLGQLYGHLGDWTKARNMMLTAINNRSDDPDLMILFAAMLLQRNESEEAARFVARAEDLLAKSRIPASDSTKQSLRTLQAQLLFKEGNKDKAAELLEELLARPLPQSQLFRLDFVAKQMELMGLNEAAERLLDEYMSQEPRGTIAMAAFKGRQGKVAEAFSLLDDARKNQPIIEILPVALETLRYFPKEVTSERCQLLEQWAKAALQTEADPQRIELLLAELCDLQGRYDDLIKFYRKILADPKAQASQRAVAQNNLAFILAAVDPTPERGAEALKLTEESIQILGPTSELLDTRALAYMAQGMDKQAAADMRVAAADTPSIAKYYHLAQIEKKLGNMDAAREAMAKATALHGDHNPFTPAERKGFEQLQLELK